MPYEAGMQLKLIFIQCEKCQSQLLVLLTSKKCKNGFRVDTSQMFVVDELTAESCAGGEDVPCGSTLNQSVAPPSTRCTE